MKNNHLLQIHDDPNRYRYDLNDAGSATECTGLMATPARDEDEQAAYNTIFHYGLPEIVKEQT